jgi:dihydrofolate synthase/folylpolyglutamate synthase
MGYAAEVTDAVLQFGLTFFEAVTVLGFHAFAREGVDVAAVEVGLGGRFDATNVCSPQVSAVTNVALDHADYLGDTLAQIAFEKAGVMKAGVPFVTAETDPEILRQFRSLASERGVRMVEVDVADEAEDIVVAVDHTSFDVETRAWGPLRLRTPLVGLHQAANTLLAVRILEQMPQGMWPPAVAVQAGVETVVHPGRDQIEVVDGKTWVFDVAHNTAGILSLVDTVDRLDLPRPLVVLVGVLGDKDWRSMLPPLFARADYAVLTQAPSAPPERRWDATVAADAVAHLCPMRLEGDFAEAMKRARAEAGDGTVLVTGSVHTVGSALTLLGREPLGH